MKLHACTYHAARVVPGEPPDDESVARFGRYWFFWLPRLRNNGGTPWRDEVFEVQVQWLYFGVSVSLWPSARYHSS